MSMGESAPSRDLGASPRPCMDLIGRLAGVPRLRGAVTVSAWRRRDPDFYKLANAKNPLACAARDACVVCSRGELLRVTLRL
ncbi:phosphatidylinositol N-acetylglucosaminyltransferase subunit Y isoform X1 [Apodemus sylvaticus]|uniref:phosphatidylinositol N-acetylglucosaminyltransferase subunit Y isoform X1 n=1 Tax=Apodemus sylvaticus TaxID=10129 RepID=UPI002242C788|nr:phosphatidylinositol N-acetylglucosaminyltransferase subunit Y isoform X1 [Apodemus sylvaticus]